MSIDLRNHPLYAEVITERGRLKELEATFSTFIDNGSVDLTVGRQYAAAVQAYTQAVMTWLSWIETETLQAARTGKPASSRTDA
jgi:hypothetical protein